MKLTLLLDLDNTLLENKLDVFLPAYFRQLSRQFPQWPSEVFIQKLLNATRSMVKKNDPRYTLEQVFDEIFYPSLGIKKEAMVETLDRFYRYDFNQLESLTHPRPDAVKLVEQALSEGCDIVIATNPVFPLSAIQNRLRWAGFPNLSSFKLVTSFEHFHFTKPYPSYFAEILAQIGYPDQPVLMVGDSYDDDILAATSIGIPSFWINEGNNPLHSPLIRSGRLNEVWGWVNEVIDQTSRVTGNGSIPAILATLKSTPAALDTVCKNLTPAAWQARPEEKEWAANEILCHLRDVDREVNLPRINQVSQGLVPFLPGMVTDVWAEERNYIAQSGTEALAEFIDTRSQICQILDQLTEDGWNQSARHAIFGPTSLRELTGFIATHDIVHIHQVVQTIRSISKSA